jgi:hypothetical protein
MVYADVLVTVYFAEKDNLEEGLAFLYLGNRLGLSKKPAWIGNGNERSAMFGSSGAGLGDVNRDGFGDIIISASQASHGQLREGGAFVFCAGQKEVSLQKRTDFQSALYRRLAVG